MPYQQGYLPNEYGYPEYGDGKMYQTNQGNFSHPTQHPVVMIPQQPRQNVSQYYTPPESFQSHQPAASYQQYPPRYETPVQQHFYNPQSQQYYSQGVPQHQSFQFQSAPALHIPGQHMSRAAYQQAPQPTTNPRNPHPGDQVPHYSQSREQQRHQFYAQASHQLPSSPDPLSTPQFQVHSQRVPFQSQPPSRSQQTKPENLNQSSPRPPAEIRATSNSSQPRHVARVEIPVKRMETTSTDHNMLPSVKRRRSNEGTAMHVCEPLMPGSNNLQPPLSQQQISSPLTELPSSQLPPSPKPNADYQAVLLALADDYITAAYSMTTLLVTGDDEDERCEQYHRLIATAMGCLESVLKNYTPSDFRAEARLRLRLASLMFEETENDQEAEEILSKGVAMCERSRLSDLKYAMHHVLARIAFKTRPKAALKTVDKLIQEVEALKVPHWTYAFRFLRVSLGLQIDDQSEMQSVLKHLRAILEAAEESRVVSVQIVAAILEAVVHIRSGCADAVELAQRAMASARTHQLGPEMQRMPQARTLLNCLDLVCCLIHFNPAQASLKMQQMQQDMDAMRRESGWQKNGNMFVQLTASNNDELGRDTCGIMHRNSDGNAALSFRWITKSQLLAIGYLLSGVVNMYRNIADVQGEKFLDESLKLSQLKSEPILQSLAAATESNERHAAIAVVVNSYKIFKYCGSHGWTTAHEAIQQMRTGFSQRGTAIDKGTTRMLLYLEALCRQGRGELQAALTLYNSPDLTFEPDAKGMNVERDLRVLATLNGIFIRRTLGPEEFIKSASLVSAVEQYCMNHTNKAIKAVYYIIRATEGGSNIAMIKRKQYLQTAVDAAKALSNNQLLNIVMNIMTAKFFTHIVGEQAEKSARAGRSLAKKAQDSLWMLVADGMFEDVMERCGKPGEAEAARREANSLMAELPEPLRDSLQTNGV